MRVYYIDIHEALSMMGSLPFKKRGEQDKSYNARVSAAADKMEKDFGLKPHIVPGKRARRYRLDHVEAAQKNITPIAA